MTVLKGSKLLPQAMNGATQVLGPDHFPDSPQPEADLRAASCLGLGRMVASPSNKILQSKRASRRTASGAT
eukprot:4510835-Pleurochrysis_carterae.AAC.1